MKLLEAVRSAIFEARECIPLDARVSALAEIHSAESGIRDLIEALESTTWSSGCWCSGKDRKGHSATCEGRRAAIRAMGGTPPGKDFA